MSAQSAAAPLRDPTDFGEGEYERTFESET